MDISNWITNWIWILPWIIVSFAIVLLTFGEIKKSGINKAWGFLISFLLIVIGYGVWPLFAIIILGYLVIEYNIPTLFSIIFKRG